MLEGDTVKGKKMEITDNTGAPGSDVSQRLWMPSQPREPIWASFWAYVGLSLTCALYHQKRSDKCIFD